MPPGLSDLSRRSFIALCTCKQPLCTVTAAVRQLVYSYQYACFLAVTNHNCDAAGAGDRVTVPCGRCAKAFEQGPRVKCIMLV